MTTYTKNPTVPVDMREPKVGTWLDDHDEPDPLDVAWKRTLEPDALWTEDEFETPETLDVEHETTIRLVWRGEAWPKFTTVLTGDIDAAIVTTETLGAACAVTMRPGPAATYPPDVPSQPEGVAPS